METVVIPALCHAENVNCINTEVGQGFDQAEPVTCIIAEVGQRLDQADPVTAPVQRWDRVLAI